MRKMICATCHVEFRRKKVGVACVEMFDSPPKPYKVWHADLFECPGCHAQIVADFADSPMAEHFMDAFGNALGWANAKGRYDAYEHLEDVPVEANSAAT